MLLHERHVTALGQRLFIGASVPERATLRTDVMSTLTLQWQASTARWLGRVRVAGQTRLALARSRARAITAAVISGPLGAALSLSVAVLVAVTVLWHLTRPPSMPRRVLADGPLPAPVVAHEPRASAAGAEIILVDTVEDAERIHESLSHDVNLIGQGNELGMRAPLVIVVGSGDAEPIIAAIRADANMAGIAGGASVHITDLRR